MDEIIGGLMSGSQPKDLKTALKHKDLKPKDYTPPAKKVFVPLKDYKPLPVVDQFTNKLAGFFVFLSTLLVYVLTQARTMSFWDSGEYATCSSILGVPHPPGNPFYIIFGRAMCALGGSVASHAIITAFISALASALAVLFTYLLTVKLVSMYEKSKWLVVGAGLLAALYTAYSFTFWMNAVEAEVYSGLVFFVNLILWLTMIWVQKSEDFDHQNILLAIVYIFFLGFCVHQTALQVAPAVLFIVTYPLIMKAIKEGKFWFKAIALFLMLIIGYYIANKIGESIKVPTFGKWTFTLLALGIMYANLRHIVDNKIWLLGLALIGIGLSPHLFLWIRSEARPFINEGYPHTMQLFIDYILRRQYGVVSFFERRATFGYQLGTHFLRYFGWQWFHAETMAAWFKAPQLVFAIIGNLITILLGVLGIFDVAKRNKHTFAYFMSIFIITTVAMIFIMNLSDAEVRDRDYFFVVAYNMWAIWVGMGAISLLRPVLNKKAPLYALSALMLALPLVNLASQYKIHDRSSEFMALDYGMNFLNSVEENAIIFTNGDNDTFPLWFGQAVADPNTKEFVHQPKNVYPDSDSKQAMKKAMDFKNNALKGIRKDVTIANLSLLNTPWYIRQLRDREGVLFDWPDSLLDDLSYTPPPDYGDPYPMINMLFKNISPTEKGFNIKIDAPDPVQDFSLNYSSYPMWRKEGIFRVSDLAVIKIIQDNYGKRPIYFAVTCENYVGFDKFTSNEGMVSRVVSTEGTDQMDINRLLFNTDKVYSYRSISDKKVYKDDNMRRLIMNYGAAYDRASAYFLDRGDDAKARFYLDKAFKFISSDFSKEVRLVNLLLESKKTDEAYKVTQQILTKKQDEVDNYLFLAKLWISHDIKRSYEVLYKATDQFPKDLDLAYFIYDMGLQFRSFDSSKQLLEKMKPGVGDIIAPYIDSLSMYSEYFKSGMADTTTASKTKK